MLLNLKAYSNPISISILFIKLLKVDVSNSTIEDTVKNHPDYPSLLSISDSLNKWKVHNACFKVDKSKIWEIPLPFITHIKKEQGSFVVITKVEENAITYQTSNKRKDSITQPIIDFLKEWDGIVLIAEPTNESGEMGYKKSKQKEFFNLLKFPTYVIIGLIFSSISIIINSFSISFLLLCIIKFIGLIVTSLLLWYEVDKANPFLKQICTGSGKVNCNAILNSNQSKLLGIFSWSEIGFYYFAGGWLMLIFSSWFTHTETIIKLAVLLNIFAVPYTIFSIYYQWRVIKQWCKLCVTVQFLLLSELIVSILTKQLHFGIFQLYKYINLSNILLIFTGFIFPIVIWNILKSPLLKNEEAKNVKKHLMRLKYNTTVFETLLKKQKVINSTTEGLGILLGNPYAKNTIIKVCNPYCSPCAKAHNKIESLINSNPNIKIQVLFTATNKEGDIKTPPVKHLLAIASENDSLKTAKAMDDWYNAPIKDYTTFSKMYPISEDLLEKQNIKIEEMSNWCNNTKIVFTPTYFINGYQLPELYNIDDVGYFMEE